MYHNLKNELCNSQQRGKVPKCIFNTYLSKKVDYLFFWYCILYFSGSPIFCGVNIEDLHRFIRTLWCLRSKLGKTIPGSSTHKEHTVQLGTTPSFDFKAPKFPHHVLYCHYFLEEENPYMQIYIYWVSYNKMLGKPKGRIFAL